MQSILIILILAILVVGVFGFGYHVGYTDGYMQAIEDSHNDG